MARLRLAVAPRLVGDDSSNPLFPDRRATHKMACFTCLCVLVVIQGAVRVPTAMGQDSASKTAPNIISYRSVGRDARPIRLQKPQLRIDDQPGCSLNRISSIATTRANVLVIANAGNHQLCFFSPEGKLIRAVGRAGKGPGEFRGMFSLSPFTPDSLLVYDHLLQRFSVFDAFGRFSRSFVLKRPGATVGSVAAVETFGDGTLIVAYADFLRGSPQPKPVSISALLYRHGGDGNIVSKLGRWHLSEHFIQAVPPQFGSVAYWDLPFGRKLKLGILRDGLIVSEAADFNLKQYSKAGKLIKTHQLPESARRVTAADIRAYKQQALAQAGGRRAVIEKMLAEMPYPTMLPTVQRLLADRSNGVWFEVRSNRTGGVPEWLFLNVAKRQVTKVVFPPGFTPKVASTTRVCGVERDNLDVESVVCFAVSSA
ncbi:MAG: 6-bladed beta-propeller [Gemmatimonadota bacterium]